MKLRNNDRNIPLMYAICFFQGIVLYASISTLYRQARGLSLAEYAIIDGFSYLFQLAFEIPFGMLADRIGYKKTLVFSNGLYLISKIIFWQAFGFTSFLLERLFFSMALAGLSGVDVSILYLSCGKQDSQKVFGRYSAFGTAGMLTGCLIFTLFLSTDYSATALGTVISYGIAFILSFFITDVREAESKAAKPSLKRLLDVCRVTFADKRFLLFILGEALLSYGTWAVSVMLNQGKYISLGLTEQHIGIIELSFSAIALTAAGSAALTKKLGFRRFFVICISTVAISTLVMGITGSALLAILCGAMIEMAYGLAQPLINDLYSKRVAVADRATQLSVYAMLTEGFSFGLSFLMALITGADALAPFLFSSALCVAGILLFLICYRSRKHLDT